MTEVRSFVPWLKDLLRPWRDVAWLLVDVLLDAIRYIRHGGLRRTYADPARSEYRAVKIYHRLEKALVLGAAEKGRGGAALSDLKRFVERMPRTGALFHRSIAGHGEV